MEVLIAVLVSSVGLVGAAMMQLHAFRMTQQSNFNDVAVTLAMQIADEIRANDQEMRKPGGLFSNVSYSGGATGSIPRNCYAQTCTSSQLAVHSLVEWKARVKAVLPGGRLEICRDSTMVDSAGQYLWCSGPGGPAATAPVTIKIGWHETGPDGSAVTDPSPRVSIMVSPFTQ